MSNQLRLSPKINGKAKSALVQARTEGAPFCVLTWKKENGKWKTGVTTFNGLSLDEEAVRNGDLILEFYASPNADMDELQRLGIIW